MNLYNNSSIFTSLDDDDLPQANRPATEGRDGADDLPVRPLPRVVIAEAKLPRRHAHDADDLPSRPKVALANRHATTVARGRDAH